jgi:tungstate transport system substrate-binding protein
MAHAGLASGVFVLLITAAACGRAGSQPYLVLATTTSVGNSGLLDVLAAAWRRETQIDVRPTLVGSGRALRMLADGQADVVISHAPGTEASMLEARATWRYRKIMFNEFVLVGPSADPAGVAAAPTLEDALDRIVRSRARFVSRGDRSGTHEREEALWKVAGARPPRDVLLTSGAGMAVTLRQASDREAYTLSDRATFDQLRRQLALTVVFAGDDRLMNTYAVIVDEKGSRRAAARQFADWLERGEGRRVIADYRIAGSDIQPFTVWPDAAPRDVPDARPR